MMPCDHTFLMMLAVKFAARVARNVLSTPLNRESRKPVVLFDFPKRLEPRSFAASLDFLLSRRRPPLASCARANAPALMVGQPT